MADLRPEKPNLRPERPGWRTERLDLRPKRPDLRPERSGLGSKRLNLRPAPRFVSPSVHLSITFYFLWGFVVFGLTAPSPMIIFA